MEKLGAQCLGKAAPRESALKKRVLELTPSSLGSSEQRVLIEKHPGGTWGTRVAHILSCPALALPPSPANLRLGFGRLIPANVPGKEETRSSESAQVVG